MSTGISGQTAVVTGAASGLGRATALRLAARGAKVACGDLDENGVRETASLVQKAGGRASPSRVDITRSEDVQDWHTSVTSRFGAPSLLLNVAGVLDRRMMADLEFSAFMRSLEVNAGGAYLVTRTFADDLRAHASARVVNVASIAGANGYPYPGYAASKAALLNLTRALLIDFWGSGTTINTVCPGAMDTPMITREAIPAMSAKTPLGRIATAQEVAGVIEFLCSEAAACINGASIVVDGGATAVFRYFEESGE